MGLLLTEIVASAEMTLSELVDDLLKDVGPAFYKRTDLRLRFPIAKDKMVEILSNQAPPHIGNESVQEVRTMDGVKYILSDDSWLLIRPSGTEPVLRVYAEGRSPEMVDAMLGYGESVAANIAS